MESARDSGSDERRDPRASQRRHVNFSFPTGDFWNQYLLGIQSHVPGDLFPGVASHASHDSGKGAGHHPIAVVDMFAGAD